jgi:hypothetical protein
MALSDLDYLSRQYITMVDENEAFARRMLNQSSPSRADLRWATASLFYTAVHYVNAYLWEQARLEPNNHEERGRLMHQWPHLSELHLHYDRLKDAGWRARYSPTARLQRGDIQYLLVTDVQAIRNAIREHLGL